MSVLALPSGRPQAEWHGFRRFSYDVPPRTRLDISADYAGPDNFPLPLMLIQQRQRSNGGEPHRWRYDMIELTEDELRWLVEEVAPVVLARMAERP